MRFEDLTDDQKEIVRMVYAGSNLLTYEACIEHLDRVMPSWR